MALCPLSTLEADACTNQFFQVAKNDTVWKALVLQLLYSATGGAETLDELMEQACENGFDKIAANDLQFKFIMLQLLCNNT